VEESVRRIGLDREPLVANELSAAWLLTLASTVVCYVLLCMLFMNCTADDAYISFRYAENLAEGKGLVFNGGERVEGFSNLLWVLILSAARRIGLATPLASKLLGVLCGSGCLLLLARLSRREMILSPSASLAMVGFLATHSGFIYYSISGMETIAYTYGILLMNFSCISGNFIVASLICSALMITRPEGVLFLVPLTIAVLQAGKDLRRTLIPAVIPIGVGCTVLAFRLYYYHAFLPNTFGAKINTQVSLLDFLVSHTRSFWAYTMGAFEGAGWWAVLAITGCLLVINRKLACLALSAVLIGVFVWCSEGDWMGLGRFWIPALPAVVLFCFVGIDRLVKMVPARSRGIGRALPFLLFVPLVLNLGNVLKVRNLFEGNKYFNPAMHSREHKEVGLYLSAIGGPHEVVVVNEIGAIGYFSRMHVRDMLGLLQPAVADLKRREGLAAYAEYLVADRPRFVLLNDKQEPWDTEMHPLQEAVFDQIMHAGGYREEKRFMLNYYKNLVLYIREGDGGKE